MDASDEQRNKSHKSRVTGNKAVRRDDLRKKKAGIDLEPNRGKNPKAFQARSALSGKSKMAEKSLAKKEVGLYMPTMDRTFAELTEEPPLLVAVVGPPKSGKTTLIRSLVKFYANRNVQHIRGAITVVAGKSRRLTFFECPNTLAAMCDMVKVADLVLMMVDGNYGFEMETFEFLNIAQIHGMPKILGIVSHLDLMQTNKALKKRKKFLRHRFWHEVAQGAKVVCLSPMQHQLYRPTDVLKLHRILICVQTKIQNWRNTHSCVLIDRHEDITPADAIARDDKCNRTVAFHGYVRGRPMKAGQLVHIPGLGDFPLSHLSHQEDPCKFSEMGRSGDSSNSAAASGGKSQGHKMRHLSAKQKRYYAPYSDIGGLAFDDDAIYITEDPDRANVERSGEGLELLRNLQRAPQPMDVRGQDLAVVRRPLNFKDDMSLEPADLSDAEVLRTRGKDADDDDDDDDDEDDDEDDLFFGDKKDQFPHGDLSLYGLPTASDDSQYGARSMPGLVDDAPEFALAPRYPSDPDSVRINTLRFAASVYDDAAFVAQVKQMFVTGLAKGAAGGEGGEGDDGAEDKGYDSTDDEFEAATKPNGKRLREEASDSDGDGDRRRPNGGDDDDDDDDDDAGAPSSSAQPKPKGNALASIPTAAGKLSKNDRYSAAAAAASASLAKQQHAPQGDEYDILQDDDDGGDDDGAREGHGGSSGGGGPTFAPNIQSLIDHFIGGAASSSGAAASSSASGGGRRGVAGGPLVSYGAAAGGAVAASASTKDDRDSLRNVEGVTLFDPSEPRTRGANPSATKKKLELEDQQLDDEATEAITTGAKLSEQQETYLKKKMAKKKAFDESYDVDGSKNNTTGYYHQLKNDVEQKKQAVADAIGDMQDLEQKIKLVGYFSGLYVRFVIENVPVEFIRNFDPTRPLIAGGLNPGEDQLQIVTAKIKRHRWYPRILKAMDPLLISIGWRRVQTQPIYANEDPNGRLRYLKYTPLHMHCYAAFYAPVSPPNTGFIAIPVEDMRLPSFRCLATGYTVGNDSCTAIVKKLKLTGTPQMIQKTTVFVKGMFNSDIEAAKFVGAKLKSVSGLRGMIKAVVKGKGGLVRATFEDKLLASDIVFIRAWKPVDPPRFCSFMPNLVDPSWKGMRTMAQLRRDLNVPLPPNPDSEYKEINRRRRVDQDEPDRVLLSRNLRMHLPFSMKEEFIPLKATSAAAERKDAALTVAPEKREMLKRALINEFSDKAEVMGTQKKEAKRLTKMKAKRETAADDEEYARALKKAKKETARKQEFRAQHKSRAAGKK